MLPPIPQPLKRRDTTPLENETERKANLCAKELGYWQAKFKSAEQRSLPDRIYANKHGFIFFIEYKREKKRPTASQYKKHDEMRKNGCVVFWTDSLEVAKLTLLLYSEVRPCE